ncbi:hypothetical protein U1Q18_031096, partial [Sarracenia purpurea var. burkii]
SSGREVTEAVRDGSRCSWSGGEWTERGEEAAGSLVIAAAADASSTGPSSTGTSISSTAAGFSMGVA